MTLFLFQLAISGTCFDMTSKCRDLITKNDMEMSFDFACGPSTKKQMNACFAVGRLVYSIGQ